MVYLISFLFSLSFAQLVGERPAKVRCVSSNRLHLTGGDSPSTTELEVGLHAKTVEVLLKKNEKLVIPVNGDEPYYSERKWPESKIEKPTSRNHKKLLKRIGSIDLKNIKERVGACYDPRAEHHILKSLEAPMLKSEVLICKEFLDKAKRLNDCSKNGNCFTAYHAFYKDGKPKQEKYYSFNKLLTSQVAISKEAQQPALWLAAQPAVLAYDAGITAAFYMNRKFIKKGLRRNVVRATGSKAAGRFVGRWWLKAAIGGTLASSYAIAPLAAIIFGSDECEAEKTSLLKTTETNRDCVGYKGTSLNLYFKDDFNTILEHPDEFLRKIANDPNGLHGRLACSGLEALSDEWDEQMHAVSCSGRTINVEPHKYLMDANGDSLYRNESVDHRIQFSRGQVTPAKVFLANGKNAGTVPRDQIEHRVLQAMFPRIDEVINACPLIAPNRRKDFLHSFSTD